MRKVCHWHLTVHVSHQVCPYLCSAHSCISVCICISLDLQKPDDVGQCWQMREVWRRHFNSRCFRSSVRGGERWGRARSQSERWENYFLFPRELFPLITGIISISSGHHRHLSPAPVCDPRKGRNYRSHPKETITNRWEQEEREIENLCAATIFPSQRDTSWFNFATLLSIIPPPPAEQRCHKQKILIDTDQKWHNVHLPVVGIWLLTTTWQILCWRCWWRRVRARVNRGEC